MIRNERIVFWILMICRVLAEPEPPLLNYAGYCTPLTRGQVEKLDRPQSRKAS